MSTRCPVGMLAVSLTRCSVATPTCAMLSHFGLWDCNVHPASSLACPVSAHGWRFSRQLVRRVACRQVTAPTCCAGRVFEPLARQLVGARTSDRLVQGRRRTAGLVVTIVKRSECFTMSAGNASTTAALTSVAACRSLSQRKQRRQRQEAPFAAQPQQRGAPPVYHGV